MAVRIDDHPLTQQIEEGLAPLGGERRVVVWRKSNRQLPSECLSCIQDKVANDEACRVVLLTPAYFTCGSRPTWLLSKKHNVEVELQAITNGRAQVISGWDFAQVAPGHRGGLPKPTRRLVPAGSVYFLKLSGDKAHIKSWVEKMWMQCASDDSPDGDKGQYRRDGFGLAAVGVWDGQLQPMNF